MATTQQQPAICPVVGTTTSVLPPNHPTYSTTDPEARCPITNAKVAHHDDSVIHNHPSSGPVSSPPASISASNFSNANACPALKNANVKGTLTDATCPVVGPVSAFLPPSHPQLGEDATGEVCPVTNARLEHHEGKVHVHPKVAEDAAAGKCPVVGNASVGA